MGKNYDYCHGFKSKIERCLNCPYPKCVIDARERQYSLDPQLRPLSDKIYIVKRTIQRLTKDEISETYVQAVSMSDGKVTCGRGTRGIKRAKRFSIEEASVLVDKLPKKFNYTYEIVKRSDEIERIEQSK